VRLGGIRGRPVLHGGEPMELFWVHRTAPGVVGDRTRYRKDPLAVTLHCKAFFARVSLQGFPSG
jgi:hypothetical protein